MNIGRRLIVDKTNDKVVYEYGEYSGDGALPRQVLGELAYIDLPYNKYDHEFKNLKRGLDSIKVKNYETGELEFDLREEVETEEEKLRREKEELENQLLLKENKALGGIL